MDTILLQDYRKKVTKDAYKQLIIDTSETVIQEYIECYNLPVIDTNNINQVCDFMLTHVFTPEYNYKNNKDRYPNLQYRITEWVKNRMDVGYETYPICEWLIETKQVESELIPNNRDLTTKMQLAAERHFQYAARTFIDNCSSDVLSKLY